MLKELAHLKQKHYVVLTATILALFGPGFLCLFHFKNNLISSLDIVKLLILSISITLPLIILNFLVITFALVVITDNTPDEPIEIIWAMAALLTAAVLYIGLYASFIWNLPFRQFTFVLIWIEVVIIAISVCIAVWKHCKKINSN